MDIKLSKERENLINNDWEHTRIESMLLNIRKGDIVYDVGAEQGDMTAMLAMKGARVVAFEPSPVMWGHIKKNFTNNNLELLDYYVGFVSDKTDESKSNYDDTNKKGFPACAYDKLDYNRQFRHMRESSNITKQITLDDYYERTGHKPTLITIDVEGTEYRVVKGMMKVLDECQPIVYVSVHDDLLAGYGNWFHDLWGLFNQLSYKGYYLGHDHETHMVFYKKSLKVVHEIV